MASVSDCEFCKSINLRGHRGSQGDPDEVSESWNPAKLVTRGPALDLLNYADIVWASPRFVFVSFREIPRQKRSRDPDEVSESWNPANL